DGVSSMNGPTSPAARERVRLITDLGDLVIELRPDRAPASVAGFLALVDAAAYDGGSFWRTVRSEKDQGAPPISIIQAMVAAPTADPAMVEHEGTAETGLRHLDGAV